MHPLTLHQFATLTNSEKFGLLEDFGVYLEAYRLQGAHKVALFELFGFYVEVWLNQTTDRIALARAFTNYKRLDPFLKDIDLTPLYSLL